MVGAASTYWLGRKLGEEGLERFVHSRRLRSVRQRVHTAGAIGSLDLNPPPFPFTPFVLVSGALDVDARRFFQTLGCVRVVRFGGEAWCRVLGAVRKALEDGGAEVGNAGVTGRTGERKCRAAVIAARVGLNERP